MQEYERAVDLMKQRPEFDFVGPRSEELVRAGEAALGVTCPPIYRRFLRELGAGDFGSFEVYGIMQADFIKSGVPDGVWYTLTHRAEVGLPKHLLIIHDVGDGSLDCLDLSQADAGGEPPVVTFEPGFPIDQACPRQAPDFGTFFLDYVQQEIGFLTEP